MYVYIFNNFYFNYNEIINNISELIIIENFNHRKTNILYFLYTNNLDRLYKLH